MYVSPNHPDRERLLARQQAQPPADEGRSLATFRRGPDAELRVSLAEYEGRPYIGLRVWERGQDGRLWPVKGKGCSVRVGECEGMIAALSEALAIVERGEAMSTTVDTLARGNPARRGGAGATVNRGSRTGTPIGSGPPDDDPGY